MKRSMAAVGLLALLVIGSEWCGQSQAASSDDKQLAAYVRSPNIVNRLYVAKTMTDARLGRFCEFDKAPAIRIVDVDGPYGTFSFPSDATHPKQGMFRVRYAVDDCLDARTYNAVFVSRSYAPPTMIDGVPGNTLADPIVHADMRPMLTAQAILAQPQLDRCKDVRILDSAVSERPQTEDLSGGGKIELWKELWDVSACGDVLTLAVTFSRQSTRPGVTFQIQATDQTREIAAVPLRNMNKEDRLNGLLSRGFFDSPRLREASRSSIMRAAQSNSPTAQFMVATDCMLSQRCKPIERLYWALRAAHNSSPDAMITMGAWYADGNILGRDITRSVAWLKLAARSGDPDTAQYMLQRLAKAGLIDPRTHEEIVPKSTSLSDFFSGSKGESSSGNATGDTMR